MLALFTLQWLTFCWKKFERTFFYFGKDKFPNLVEFNTQWQTKKEMKTDRTWQSISQNQTKKAVLAHNLLYAYFLQKYARFLFSNNPFISNSDHHTYTQKRNRKEEINPNLCFIEKERV